MGIEVVSYIAEMRNARAAMKGEIGFVPTMGYLHEGHLALVRRARRENPIVVVSIFINPTQFGPHEDFADYPRDTDRDLELLEQENADLVFIPTADEIYPTDYHTWIDVEKITERLEGASRPGHFRGVATVVAKLFNIVEPHKAYFGQKDAQQLLVIKKMVSDLNMNIKIVAVPTVREDDGLALSSRNAYLNPEERQSALVLWNALCRAKELLQDGERNAERLRAEMTSIITANPLATIDYMSVADNSSLEELEGLDGPALVSLAVRIGKTRLIDNITLKPVHKADDN